MTRDDARLVVPDPNNAANLASILKPSNAIALLDRTKS